MVENKTKATDESVDEFVQSIEASKQQESKELLALMRDVTGEEPVMWGSSIVGFGSVHYQYESGREGDMPAVGFSPRKANFTIYIADGFNEYGALLDKLGAHTISVSCLYVKRLKDVDLAVLKEIIRRSYATLTAGAKKQQPTTIDEYLALQPREQRTRLQEVRKITSASIPNAEEAISYEMPTIRANGKNIVHFAGYADHISIYPVPKSLAEKLKPYIRSKNTLWLPMTAPLPRAVVQDVVEALLKERTKK